MPRRPRLVVPDFPHHVTQRGNRRQPTFFSEADGALYLRLLRLGCAKAGTRIWAWCLMPNHVHLILVPAVERGLRDALASHWCQAPRKNQRYLAPEITRHRGKINGTWHRGESHKLDLMIEEQAWEITGGELCLAALRRDAHRFARG